jgi:hypothetical protein
MAVLTLEAIEADPWNAVECELPEPIDVALLEAASRAVRTCISLEHSRMLEAEESRHMQRETGETKYPPVHAEHKARWQQAATRLHLIADIFMQKLRTKSHARRIDWEATD